MARYYSRSVDGTWTAEPGLRRAEDACKNGSDKEMAALANFQQALIAGAHGQERAGHLVLARLSNSGSILGSEAAGVAGTRPESCHKQSEERPSLYEQIKKDYPKYGE